MRTAKEILARSNRLKADRGQWDTLWQDLADYVMPRKSEVTDKKTPDVEGWTDDIYETEAIHDNIILSAGQLDYMVSGKWFEFVAPSEMLKNDRDASNWYKKCSEIVLELLNESNFQLEVHEFFHDRGGFGTAHLHLDEDDDDIFCFKNCPVGTFSIVEDHKGLVSEVYYEFEYTARQAVDRWGEAAVSNLILEAYSAENGKRREEKFKFTHAVYPRGKDRDMSKKDGRNKKWASIYVEHKAEHITHESGYDEQPFAVSRYLKWGSNVYGYCPSVEALPATKQVNFIERQMDALAELAAFPRMLIPEDLEGEVDFRSGGVTVFDPNNPDAKPQEWATQGRYDVGVERARVKREMIRRAYHVDLFQLLTSYDEMRRQKTAFEVAQMMSEKITRISPTFERIKSEVFKPILKRAFGIALRKGLLPPMPASILKQKPDGAVTIDVPKVAYTSKLAMAIKAVENQNFITFMGLVEPLSQLAPGAIERQLNFDRIIRGMGMNQGIPADFWNTKKEIDAIDEAQEARQQQQDNAQTMEMFRQGAGMAKDLGGAPEEVQKALLG